MRNKQERDGKVAQVKGKAKKAVATVTGDKDLKAEGQVDEAVGRVQEVVGKTRRKAGEALHQTARAVKH
jgi:uncharacterized protein YjbJ (UPF0337 family)